MSTHHHIQIQILFLRFGKLGLDRRSEVEVGPPGPGSAPILGGESMTQEGNRINQQYVVMYTVEFIIHRKLYTRSPLAPIHSPPLAGYRRMQLFR